MSKLHLRMITVGRLDIRFLKKVFIVAEIISIATVDRVHDFLSMFLVPEPPSPGLKIGA